MSTVLWANVVVQNKVVSDETDHAVLHRHAEKLDAITRSLQMPAFLGICDTTDQRYNLDLIELPEGMASTNELMAQQGVSMQASEALPWLVRLRDHIVNENIRFGLLRNQNGEVVAELSDVVRFIESHGSDAERFNFSVVT
jgi:hypothetical protein